ncbi:heavy metal translocating P-type ATPase, partial [candidate division GN15 bacterium]
MAADTKLSLRIHGMHCASCVSTVENGLARLDGMQSASVNLATASAVVQFDRDKLSQDRIIGAVSELGYSASVGQDDILKANAEELATARKQFFLSLVFSGPLFIIAMWPMLLGHHGEAIVSPRSDALFQGLLAAGALFWAGRSILADALKQARHGRANMNSLIAMGTLAAFFWSVYASVRIWGGIQKPLYFESAAVIITLILLGRLLEAHAKGKAGEAIGALMNLRPAKALAVFNNAEYELDAATVRPGMMLKIRPGERIAADGKVTEGSPVIDESMLTGESMPVEKNVGATVIGGSLNGNTPFVMKVTAAGEQS